MHRAFTEGGGGGAKVAPAGRSVGVAVGAIGSGEAGADVCGAYVCGEKVEPAGRSVGADVCGAKVEP